MKTRLALALAGAALMALPAAAQTTATPDTTTTKAAPTSTKVQANKSGTMYEMKAGQWRATKLTGLNVYNNANEKIGDVNELIVARDGKIEAVVIGVGGFLGMGEHLAAVPFDQVRWMDEPRDETVSTRTTTTTTGSGTSAAPANPPSPSTADRPATTTTTTSRPATTTTTAANTRADNAYRGYPDHAVVDMTKDQLKALPEVKYAR